MDNIPFGNYILIAGSNPDNNGLICEVAEACGEYPSIGYVEKITIDEFSPNVSDLNFETGFNQIAIPQSQGQHFLP
jgi:serine protease